MKDIPWMQLAKELQSEILDQRRHLHTIPELGFREEKTASFVAEQLEQSGYKVRRKVGKTGVVADLGSKPVVAIRAEMDGLPIADATMSQYRSTHDGVSHSCGHDVNMACTLAAAKILARLKDFDGGARIIMQPASEEVADAQGKTGTYRMIEDGALDGLGTIIALHVDATMPPGMVGIITEPARVTSGNFKIEIKAASPPGQEQFDAVRATSLLLQLLLSANGAQSAESSSIIVNSIETATTDPEALCPQVTLRGSLRVFNKEARRDEMHRLESACDAVRKQAASCQLEYLESDAPGQVDAKICEVMRQVACELVGEANVRIVKRKTWTEDFAALLKVTPGSMVLLGGQIQSSKRSHHSAAFDVDESALYIGAAILAATVYRLALEPND
jgi:amidohydrolase